MDQSSMDDFQDGNAESTKGSERGDDNGKADENDNNKQPQNNSLDSYSDDEYTFDNEYDSPIENKEDFQTGAIGLDAPPALECI
jgi:5-methylcytosine-specific restriction endonuclease McrBC GTP-binding regulatory subunit McrB